MSLVTWGIFIFHIIRSIFKLEVTFLANESIIAQKQAVVSETVEKFENSVSTIIVNTRGLTVGEDTKLRKDLREAGVEFHVIKNSMLRRAADELGYEGLEDVFKGPTAVAFSSEDVSAPAKILRDAAKENDQIEIKGGIVEGNTIDLEQIDAIAELPSRDDLLSMVASAVKAPIRKTAQTFNALAQNPLRDAMLTIKALAEKKDEDAA